MRMAGAHLVFVHQEAAQLAAAPDAFHQAQGHALFGAACAGSAILLMQLHDGILKLSLFAVHGTLF